MYAETGGLMFPYFHNFPQQFEDFYCSHKPNVSSGIPSCVIQTSAVSDYNLWAEGDLFKAPEPVIEEPAMGLDPVTAAISMISCGEDVMPTQSLAVSDIESSIQSGQLLSEVFYECRKDLLAKEGNEMPLSEVLNIKIPTDKNMTADEKLVAESPFQKSISSSCLRSMECVTEAPTLGNGNINFQSPMEQPKIVSAFTSEDRKEKLSRYRNKKSKRNFGRKIKYACRKVLADSQPRIRGRFAKTEDTETSKKR
ncbi:putative zinc finger protein CONSTANS-LIKE 11 [Sesamum angolense]|uniref:Zinc finger protein CONSTANS-LIKE 11 n=1 Tax=Sesamum angolense TaxID=2727404 RepID=A0AAE1TAF9_9LAMI|nr:putative zinc finger protein CONSTANS-LIKE 11 [Sesamum angolense]